VSRRNIVKVYPHCKKAIEGVALGSLGCYGRRDWTSDEMDGRRKGERYG
jgi:hypothetical protein